MISVRALAKSMYRTTLKPRARARIAQLQREQALPVPLLKALNDTFSGTENDEERKWLSSITALRSQLQASAEGVEVIDYGAGDSHDQRTEEEMLRGRAVQTTLAQCARASKDPFWGTLLFRLIREFRCTRGLELGTNLGVSAAYQAAAMVLNGGGELVTLEGAPALAARARQNLGTLGLSNVTVEVGRFVDTLPRVCEQHAPFDYIFIDGHHDRQATIEYFNELVPFSTPQAVLVFDDIEWSPGMRDAWQTISNDPRVQYSVGLSQLGVCVLRGGNTGAARRETIRFV